MEPTQLTNVSTPNDYALQYRDAFNNVTTLYVCKWQTGPWTVRRSVEFGSPDNVMWDHVSHLTADDYSQAVANVDAYVADACKRADAMRKEIAR